MGFIKTMAFAIAATLALAAGAAAATAPPGWPAVSENWFYVGGHYIDTPGGRVMTGSMYT
jgi:hypothetical protein